MTNLQLMTESIQLHEKGEELYNHFSKGNLLTFQEWKKKGYSVKKGEKAAFTCEIWKRIKNKKYNEKTKDKESEYIYFKKKASFFTIEQVKPMK